MFIRIGAIFGCCLALVACGVVPGMGAPEVRIDDLDGRWAFTNGTCTDSNSFAILGRQLRWQNQAVGGQFFRDTLTFEYGGQPAFLVFNSPFAGAYFQNDALVSALVKCTYLGFDGGWVKANVSATGAMAQ